MAMVDKIEDMSKYPSYVGMFDEEKLNEFAIQLGLEEARKETIEETQTKVQTDIAKKLWKKILILI